MSLLLKIDVREKELIEKVNQLIATTPLFSTIRVHIEVLPIGDIWVYDEKEQKEKIVIERKTTRDLLASLKDGRYEEQSYRLDALPLHHHNILYFIEGDIDKRTSFKHQVTVTEKLAFYSSMFSLFYFKGFTVMRTFSLEETALVLCNMIYKMEKERTAKVPYYTEKEAVLMEGVEKEDAPVSAPASAYVHVVKKVKKENITPENIGEIMLSQIPGISATVAAALMQKYGTLSHLLSEIERAPEELSVISLVNAKGQSRKIGKNCVEGLRKYLGAPNIEEATPTIEEESEVEKTEV
jgi:ERCC4-type nuclease